MLAKLFLYLSAVGNHWLFSFGGVALVVIAIIETARKKKVAERIFWVLAAICLFIAFYQAWLDEHHNTEVVIGEKAEVWSKFNQCDIERASKSVLADGYSAQIKDQRGRIDSQQGTIDSQQGTVSTCVLALAKSVVPEPQRTYFLVNETIPSKLENGEFFRQFIILTNKSVNPVRMHVGCAGPTPFVLKPRLAASSWHDSSVTLGAKGIFDVLINNPPWTPVNPLLLNVSAKDSNIGQCWVQPY
jgi:hypothetical protein